MSVLWLVSLSVGNELVRQKMADSMKIEDATWGGRN